MKNIDTKLVIAGCFILLLLPIAYYFCYALPKHNETLQQIEIEKLEYQKEQDRKKEEEKAEKERQERLEKERKEQEAHDKEQRYQECLSNAKLDYNTNLKKYCDLGYQECVVPIKEYNANLSQKYDYYGNSNELSLSQCDKFKYNEKDGSCFLPNNQSANREKAYNDALDYCERIRK